MQKFFILNIFFSLFYLNAISQIEVTSLFVDNKINPLGIDELYPELSWQLSSTKRNVTQSAFNIRVSEDIESLEKGENLIYSTGKIFSDQSVYVPFTGNTIKPAHKYYWQVRVWDQRDKASKWSKPGYWVMGIMSPHNWTANWIQENFPEKDSCVSPIFRKEFMNDKKVRLAVALITAHGLYEARLNGKKIGNCCFTPGWTSFDNRIAYQTYDVTKLLKKGRNAIGVVLGNGWYRGLIKNNGKNFYGKDLSLLFQMYIFYEDGTSKQIVSDGSWLCSTGAILSSNIYDGEVYDARCEQEGWDQADFDDSRWHEIIQKNYPVTKLITTENEPVRKHEVFTPVKIFTTSKGDNVIDFGQNIVGWVQMKVRGKTGDKITITHAEVLDKNGDFYTKNLRKAKQINIYILKGDSLEVFEPHFTWQGFRYIKIEGYPGELKADNFRAYALYSDMKPTGTFKCSDDWVNKLQHNIQWSLKGNFIDIPMEGPQRDERFGWTGDVQVASLMAGFNYNIHSFLSKWLKDLSLDQNKNGSVPVTVPDVFHDGKCSPGWGDAATVVPWNMYMIYGDKKLLEEQYESMKKWVDYIDSVSINDLWIPDFSYGDWLFYSPEDDVDGRAAVTDKTLIAQCFFACSTQKIIEAAKVLGDKEDDIAHYDSLLTRIKDVFVHEFVTPSGRLISQTQTAYVLALNFDMLPDSLRPEIASRLVQNIHSYENHITTGFLGSPYICQVLTRFGYTDVAYDVFLQRTYPSWLYPVSMGATTLWERWDGIKPDGSFQNAEMNSLNHYAYGAIGDWMYRGIAGINPDPKNPGYKSIIIKPLVTNRLSYAKAELDTYYGKIVSFWSRKENKLSLHVEIPVNTTADVYIPSMEYNKIYESKKLITAGKKWKIDRTQEGFAIVHIGSGKYDFSVQ